MRSAKFSLLRPLDVLGGLVALPRQTPLASCLALRFSGPKTMRFVKQSCVAATLRDEGTRDTANRDVGPVWQSS